MATSTQNMREALDAQASTLNQRFFDGLSKDGLRFVDELVRGSFGFNHYNPLSTKKGEITYSGRNSMRLALASFDCNYASPNWTTAKLMHQRGWKPKKNAHPVILQNWSFRNVHDDDGAIVKNEDGTNKKTSRVFPNVPFLVYNYDDIEGAPEYEQRKVEHLGEEDTLAMAYLAIQAWEAAGGARIEFDDHAECACYNFVEDVVYIPSPERFKTAKAFAGTLFHELIHSTGHKSRTGRLGAYKDGSFKYCREELVAEIGSAYIECAFGIDREYDEAHWDNHMAYVKSYASKFADKQDAIFKAANDAKYAARLLIEAIEKYNTNSATNEKVFAFVSTMDELLAA